MELRVILPHCGNICEIAERVFRKRIAPLIKIVVAGAAAEIVLIVQLAWRCFEGGEKVPYPFDISLSTGWINFVLVTFLHVGLVHRAQTSDKNICNIRITRIVPQKGDPIEFSMDNQS